jgi:hypothetical protein
MSRIFNRAPAYSSCTTPIKTVIYFPTEHENCPFCILHICPNFPDIRLNKHNKQTKQSFTIKRMSRIFNRAPAYSSRTTPIKTVIYFPTEHENCPFCILNILLCGTEMMIIVMVPCQRMLTRLISLGCPSLSPPSATAAVRRRRRTNNRFEKILSGVVERLIL